jgi:lysophospholipase L1-like esterase
VPAPGAFGISTLAFFTAHGKNGSDYLQVLGNVFMSNPGMMALVQAVVFTLAQDEPVVRLRGNIHHSLAQFTNRKVGHVAFLGGSITEMDGYRPIVMAGLTKRFPQTKFTFTNAGVASTCSTTGAFRLQEDVLAQGPVDLIFVEFAVNDDQDAHHTRRDCIRGMEGIIRHLRAHNPACDIVMIHFANESMLATIAKGTEPTSTGAHEEVAQRHQIPSVHLVREVSKRIQNGSLTWATYGGVHPARPGNELAANLVEKLLANGWEVPSVASPEPHRVAEPIDEFSYAHGRFIDNKLSVLGDGWSLSVPEWKTLKGDCRERFRKLPMLHSDKPGSTLTVPFKGRSLGAYVLAGPDAGVAEVSVDGGPFKKIPLRHPYSGGLHYPRTVMLATDLADGQHTAILRVGEPAQTGSGTAVRVVRLGTD